VHLNVTFQKKGVRPKTAAGTSSKLDKPTGDGFAVGAESQSKSSVLAKSMSQQKQEGLSEAGSMTLAAYPAVGRSPFIINDYHSRLVNQNYSRNVKGKHFTR
jgi:hypothetical protein